MITWIQRPKVPRISWRILQKELMFRIQILISLVHLSLFGNFLQRNLIGKLLFIQTLNRNFTNFFVLVKNRLIS